MTDWFLARAFTRKLRKLRRFADLVEETLVERSAALDAELAKASAELADHERTDLYEWYSDDYFELSDELPSILRYSVLTAADTAAETFLNGTCEAYAQVSEAMVRVTDLQGRGIHRAQSYLKKVARVPFPDDKPIWTAIVRLHEVRNSIIHADGMIAEEKKALREWSEAVPGLQITANGIVSLGTPFTKWALDTYQDFAAEMDVCTDHLGLWHLELGFDAVE